eukprot:m.65216 g.65216  ORF g.65216 m.65216 type:complete len:214 (-) comp8274_c0_seq2:122-763(-)
MLACIMYWLGLTAPRTLVLHATAVCARWRRVLKDVSCRLRLSFRFASRRRVGAMQSGCVRDMSVLATEYNLLSDRSLGAMLDRFGGVEGLLLFGCSRLTDSGLALIATQCPRLTWLSLATCGKRITDKGLRVLASACRELSFLDVSKLTEISFGGLQHVGEACPKLRIVAAADMPVASRRVLSGLLPRRVRVVTKHNEVLALRRHYMSLLVAV